jgi:hypothetical protein
VGHKEKELKANVRTARVVGALFLIAMVVSLVGGIWLESIITAPDYLRTVSENETQVIVGVLLELINGIAVVGIAVALFPIFRKQDEALALGYVASRIIESVIILAALVIPLVLLALSQDYVAAGAPDAPNFEVVGHSLLAVRANLAGQILGIVFSLAALLFYILLYQSRLVPRLISIWGLIAVVSLFTWNLLELLGLSISVGMIFALPIMLNEIFLGFWLILKGFSSPNAISESER